MIVNGFIDILITIFIYLYDINSLIINYIIEKYNHIFYKKTQLRFKVIELVKESCPVKGSVESAGYDFSYRYENEILLKPGDIKIIPLGVKIQMDSGIYLKIESRSGLASKGINCTGGVVDSDYTGEYKLILNNMSKEDFIIQKGMRLCQGVFLNHLSPQFIITNEFSKKTIRGDKGYGSTGIF